MISIIKEVIEPLTQAAIWGTGGYAASKVGAKKARSAAERKEQQKQAAKQAAIGAGAGGVSYYGASGLAAGVKKAKEAIVGD